MYGIVDRADWFYQDLDGDSSFPFIVLTGVAAQTAANSWDGQSI